jgi:hypothetical protein
MPIIIPYLFFCFTLPLFKFGKIKKSKGSKIYITKDLIHSDYVFNSKDMKDLFDCDKKYLKVGWGDRKIFLETKNWNNLRLKDLIFAFFGINKTVLRTECLENLPKCKFIELDVEQLKIIKKHIKDSYNKNLIKKNKNHYPYGNYYESDLNYNCVNTCNNWINQGLRKAKITNRIWCPLSYWL